MDNLKEYLDTVSDDLLIKLIKDVKDVYGGLGLDNDSLLSKLYNTYSNYSLLNLCQEIRNEAIERFISDNIG